MREVLQQPEPGRATEKHLEIVSPENAKPPPVTARVSYACGFDSHSLWNLPCRWREHQRREESPIQHSKRR